MQNNDIVDDSDASLKKTFMRISREQLLEDLAVKDKQLGACKAKEEKSATPWWMKAIIVLATIFLLIIAIWGIVALVYANRLSSGVTAARMELAATNAEIARRLQLLDDTQRVIYELRNNIGTDATTNTRIAQLQVALDAYAPSKLAHETEPPASMYVQKSAEVGVTVPRSSATLTSQEQGTRIFV